MSIRRSSIDRLNEARKSSLPTIGRGKPLNSQGNEGDLTFRRTSDGLMLFITAYHSWLGVKVGESFSSLEKVINDVKSKVDVMKQFRLPSTYSVTGDFTLDVSGDITFDADGGQVYIKDGGASHFLFDCDNTSLVIYDDTDAADVFKIVVGASGATTIGTIDDGAAIGHLTLDPDGDLIVSGADVKIDATKRLYLDGGSNTYLMEHSADHVRLIVGGDDILRFNEGGTDGNTVHFKDCSAGFDQREPTYNATDTDVDFRVSNKQFLTFGAGNIADLNLKFPAMSGNFILLLKQDASGSRTINSDGWLVFDSQGNAAAGSATVKFPGGSNPTLTTAANHVDIVSFYWDADNEIAYGVATLDFQD